MCFVLHEGDSFHFREDGEPRRHLHVVVTDPGKYDEALLVSIASMYALGDRTTILTPSPVQHSFISHESYVSYHDAKIVSVQELLSRLRDGTVTLHPSAFPPDELDRIRQGVLKSPHATGRVKLFFTSHP